jgi:hypothetical protein
VPSGVLQRADRLGDWVGEVSSPPRPGEQPGGDPSLPPELFDDITAEHGGDGPRVGDYRDAYWLLSTVIPEVLRFAARHTRHRRPEDVTTGQFDRHKAAAGHKDCRTAQVICRDILFMQWAEVRELALGPEKAISARVRAHRRGALPPKSVTDADVLARVFDAWTILVHERLAAGTPEQEARRAVLDRDAYVRISDAQRAQQAGHWLHGVPVAWPTIGQVDVVAGGLNKVLERLELPTGEAAEPPKPSAGGNIRPYSLQEKVAALVAFLSDMLESRKAVTDIQRQYRAWRQEHPDRDTLPSPSAFSKDHTFTVLRPVAYRCLHDPAELERLTTDALTERPGDPLLEALAIHGGQSLLNILRFIADQPEEWVEGRAVKQHVEGHDRTVGARLHRLVHEAAALEDRLIPGTPGRQLEYRLTDGAHEVLNIPAERLRVGAAFSFKRPAKIGEEAQQVLDAVTARAEPVTAEQIASELGLDSRQAAKYHLDNLWKHGHLQRAKDPHGAGARRLYWLTAQPTPTGLKAESRPGRNAA